MNIDNTRRLLGSLDFGKLFIEELGWSQPTLRRPLVSEVQGAVFHQRMVAQLAGAAVFVIWQQPPAGTTPTVPDRTLRDAVERSVAKEFRENLCIFIDREHEPTQSFWVWAKRGRDADGKPKRWVREHSYFRNQPADLFITKLHGLFFELADVAEGSNLTVVKVAQRLQSALDVERVTKQFFKDYQAAHAEFLSLITGFDNERDRRWYASVLLNRLMFVWFLQKKRFLDHDERRGHGNLDYLTDKLAQSQATGADRFYKVFLKALFFDAFAKPEADRAPDATRLCGNIPYLNGGLFLEHPLELDNDKALRIGTTLHVPDRAFENLFALFARYSWSLNDTPGGQANEINPDVLGYIFERYINVVSSHSQKDLGAYYTRPEITGYLAERAIEAAVLQKVNKPALPELGLAAIEHASVPDMLARMDGATAHELLTRILPDLKILDPAVGSGAFLVAAMKVLINIYSAIVGRAQLGNEPELKAWLKREQAAHRNIGYAIRRRIITDNLYGVDLLEGAAEIAKLRLFLALVASAETLQDLEPLPNIDFNLLRGNSLIGLMRVDEHEFTGKQFGLFATPYNQLLEKKNRDLASYRGASEGGLRGMSLRDLRLEIETDIASANLTLNDLMKDEFHRLGVKYEQATWNATAAELGKPTKKAIEREHIDALHPFHWGYVFDRIMQNGGGKGGFDIILANPPWEVFKPQAKEFFADHSDLITKNAMTIKDFEQEQTELLKNKAIRGAWLAYQSQFPHVNQYFRAAPEFRNQFGTVDGRKVGSDLNLYKLFIERCYHLLRSGGHCGIVVPSSLYTDLGAKGLRELLFDSTRIEGLFGFENRKAIFDGVHRSFKFVVLTFEKLAPQRVQQAGEQNASAPPDDLLAPTRDHGTKRFPAAFMRVDVEDLARFPEQEALWLDVDLIRRLSPDAVAIKEFKSALDVQIAQKMLSQPMLGDRLDKGWQLRLEREFHMTDDSSLYKTSPGKGRLPLWEGKQFHQFDADFTEPQYWLDPSDACEALRAPRLRALARRFKAMGIGGDPDPKRIVLNHTSTRLAFRDVARNTDERTMIATVLPPGRVCPHTVTLEQVYVDEIVNGENVSIPGVNAWQRLYLVAVFNSFVFDWLLRLSVTAHLSFFFIYNSPVPRLHAGDDLFDLLSKRAARLTCTTREFDAFARGVGLSGHEDGATGVVDRARLRAEIDGLVAHLYALSEEEFVHILGTFPLVAEPVKVAARNAYRDVAKGLLQ